MQTMKTNANSLFRILLLGAMALSLPIARASAESPTQRNERMSWWREARFGMFVHWGLYSGLAGNWDGKPLGKKGGMEWIQHFVKTDTDTYAKAALPKFQPKPGFAREWAKLAKNAGCRYLVFTTKHHDGFGLYTSKFGDYNAGAKLNRDLAKEIVDACRAEGLKVGFYHSLIDWHHDQYDNTRAKGLPYPLGGKPLPNAPRDHSKYIDYLHSQVGELLTNYGPVDILWWDFSSKNFQGDEAWRATELLKFVRSKQPQIIVNNRLYSAHTINADSNEHSEFSTDRGDFSTPEQRIPATGMPGVDWETCMTLNATWGYSDHDHGWKSEETLIRNLADIASKGGNYLLNIGPKGDGSLTPETVKSFEAIGAWMKTNSEAIYGTIASPFTNLSWGRATRKGQTIYLIVFDWPKDQKLHLPLKNRIENVSLLAQPETKITSANTESGTIIEVPASAPDKVASVLKVTISGEPEIIPPALGK